MAAAGSKSEKLFFLLLCLQGLAPVVISCITSSDCPGILQKCCYGSCTERDHCDGSCTDDINCDLSRNENCCNGYCQVSSCYDNTGLVVGLSIAGSIAFIVFVAVCIGCACRTRRTPGRVVNRRVIRTTTRTQRVVARNQQFPGYQNPGYPNQGYEEFPQPPRQYPGGVQPPTVGGYQQPPTGGYYPPNSGFYQPPPTGMYQPPTTGAHQTETYQRTDAKGGATGGVAPPSYYEAVGEGNKKALFAPQKSYGTGTNVQPSAPPPQHQ